MTYWDGPISGWDLEIWEGSLPRLPAVSGSEDKLLDRSSAKTTGTSRPDPGLRLASERLPGPGLSTSSQRAEKPDKEPVGGQPC